ncbi:MAG: FAD-dependent oxidoreductase [Myxococcales bacterium]|nr:FAD-dependent oxidoreductase [Myxococcales bacterium]
MIRTSSLDLDDNTSLWAATCEQGPASPPLTTDRTADVVIVGGGFTGLSTAIAIARRFPDRGVVVLEAKRVGNGASGRNGGMALHWVNGVDATSEERCKRLYAVTTGAIDKIRATIAEHAPQVRFRQDGCLEVYTDAKRAEEAQQKTEKMAKWGLPVRWLDGEELRKRCDAVGAVGAVLDPTTGQLHGLDYVLALKGLAISLGVTIHEESPVRSIEEGKTHVVRTDGGSVRAPTLVLATNGYTPRLGFLADRVFPLHSHAIATAPLPLERWKELGWGEMAGFTDDLDRIAYATMPADGRLLFGGGGNAAYSYYYGGRTSRPDDGAAEFAFVHDVLKRYFPKAADVPLAQRWTGTLGVTMSRVCSMGVAGEHRNVLYAVGYSGHGVVLANLAGDVLCDLYADHHEPWRDLPFYERRMGWIPPEPARWLGYQVVTRLTGRSPRTYEVDR